MQKIKFDLSSIPPEKEVYIASGVLAAVNRFLAQPGGKEYLDKKIQAKKEAALAAAKGG